jgi:hypothetical protein
MGTQGLKFALAGLAALALSACDADAGAASGQADGAPEILSGEGAIADLPSGFTAYPGASVTSANSIVAGNGSGVIAVMNTSDTPEQVIAFYRGQAADAEVTITEESSRDGNLVIAGEGPDGLVLAVSAMPGGGGTIVQLTVGRDG